MRLEHLKLLGRDEKPLVAYHGGCDDGFGGAWAAHLKLTQKGYPGADYHPAGHDTDPPDCSGRIVYLIDFSYPQAVMERICAVAKAVIVLDHHMSACDFLVPMREEGLLDPSSVLCEDEDESGCMLAWKHFHPDTSCPKAFWYISARDCGKMDIFPHCIEVGLAIRSYEQDFEVWDELMLEKPIGDLIDEGATIRRYYDRQCGDLAREATIEKIGGYSVPCANSNWFMAYDVAGELAVNHTFGAAFYDRGDGLRAYTLRSVVGGIDVSKIAAQYGGGGHTHAAGFRVERRIHVRRKADRWRNRIIPPILVVASLMAIDSGIDYWTGWCLWDAMHPWVEMPHNIAPEIEFRIPQRVYPPE